MDFSGGSEALEQEKECRNQPAKAVFPHVAFSLKAKRCTQGKKEHVFLPFKERLCHLSLKVGIEKNVST